MARKRFLHYWRVVRGNRLWPVVDSTHNDPVMESFDVFFLVWLKEQTAEKNSQVVAIWVAMINDIVRTMISK